MGTDCKKKKRHEQKVTAKEKKGTGVMKTMLKKILEKHVLFAKQLLWHLHGP